MPVISKSFHSRNIYKLFIIKLIMKKVFVLFVLSLVILSLVSFVIAQGGPVGLGRLYGADSPTSGETNFERAGKAIASAFSTNLDLLFLGPNTLTILLLGLLLWIVLYSVVRQLDLFQGSPLISFVISLIVTLLSFIYLRNQPTFLNLIAGQYAAVGAVILVVIPFLLAIYFTAWVSRSLIIAKGIWLAFFVYYAIIFLSIWGKSTTGFFSEDTVWYLGSAIASLILFFYIPYMRKGFLWIKAQSDEEKADETTGDLIRGIRMLGDAGREGAGKPRRKRP